MMYRCLNNLLGYCSTKPTDYTGDESYCRINPETKKIEYHTCKTPRCPLNALTCGNFKTFTETLNKEVIIGADMSIQIPK